MITPRYDNITTTKQSTTKLCTYIMSYTVLIIIHKTAVTPFLLESPQSRINTLRPRQNGRHFVDDVFKCVFLNSNVWISRKISLKFVPKSPINNIPSLVQIMAWRRQGDKSLSETMVVSLPTHICVTRPQWVKPSVCMSVHRQARQWPYHGRTPSLPVIPSE